MYEGKYKAYLGMEEDSVVLVWAILADIRSGQRTFLALVTAIRIVENEDSVMQLTRQECQMVAISYLYYLLSK